MMIYDLRLVIKKCALQSSIIDRQSEMLLC
jgi:hypothetical protein